MGKRGKIMKIALVQMDVKPNQPAENVARMLDFIQRARKESVDLVAFPEMAVGGYLLGDRWLEDSFCRELMSFNEVIREASEGIAVVFGNIYVDDTMAERMGEKGYHPNKDGRGRKYNAAVMYQNGKPARRRVPTDILPEGIQPKTLLPNYRFFDDERYFFSLPEVALDAGVPLEDLMQPFVINTYDGEVAIGLEICEDLWCNDYRKNGEPIDGTKMLLHHGAEYIVNISSSPWTYEKNQARDRRVRFIKQNAGKAFKPFFYVNCTGAQNNGKNIVTFDGGSTVYNSDGNPVCLSREPYREEMMMVNPEMLKEDEKQRVDNGKISQKMNAILRGILHLKDMMGIPRQPRFMVGLSGGVDSALAASLLTIALGKSGVLGVTMPSRYNSEKTKEAAAWVARKLGIELVEIPIEGLVTMNRGLIDGCDLDGSGKPLSTFHLENLQAKIRGTSILSNLCAKYNALFTNNGNKLETALGYATLYGDVGGAIAPLGDLTKEEVFEMAAYLNREVFKEEVIPNLLLPDELFRFSSQQIQPSAELREDQVDPMKFGYHCRLIEQVTDFRKKSAEDIMEWYLEGTMERHLGISYALMERWNIHEPAEFIADLEWFFGQIQRSVFKRIQAPPIIITSKSAYGYDIRESILPKHETKEYRRLKQEILKLKAYPHGAKREK
jgi:NAD+ synthase (glutamine-hydrolysing)